MKRALMGCLFALIWIGPAQAHKPSDSLLTLTANGDLIDGQWDIALRDLDHAIGLDSNDDGAITWGELRQRRQAIVAYALPRLHLVGSAGACRIAVTDHLVDRHSDGVYAVLRFVVDCSLAADAVVVRYSLFRGIDPQHRGILRVGGSEDVFLFSEAHAEQRIPLARPPINSRWHAGAAAAFRPGSLLLFVALLLPLLHQRGPLTGIAKIAVALIVAQFLSGTLAITHALTLSLSVLNAGAIATIGATAIPIAFFQRRRWVPVFAFGLLTGCSFATAIDEAAPAGLTMHDVFMLNAGFIAAQFLIGLVCAGWASAHRAHRTSGWWAKAHPTVVRAGRLGGLKPTLHG